MGNKPEQKKPKKYYTLMETLWKIGAPLIVAVAKTVFEGKAASLFK